MLTYILFKTQSMLLSATSRKGQADADSHSVQNPEHALVSNKQEGPAEMLTYKLFKTQGMLLSAPQDKPKKNINLHSVYNQSTFLLASS
jgi:hypothetical protein